MVGKCCCVLEWDVFSLVYDGYVLRDACLKQIRAYPLGSGSCCGAQSPGNCRNFLMTTIHVFVQHWCKPARYSFRCMVHLVKSTWPMYSIVQYAWLLTKSLKCHYVLFIRLEVQWGCSTVSMSAILLLKAPLLRTLQSWRMVGGIWYIANVLIQWRF